MLEPYRALYPALAPGLRALGRMNSIEEDLCQRA
jgi:hypothetical protein